ncbi:MAG TPA: hypothetical protein VKS79_23065 [Gemmataceae bacterium]|nr:hypothetical protein [Gemmataceae bacterium]
MFYFLFHAAPDEGNPEKDERGGAYVCCWIDRNTRAEAEKAARAMISKEGWLIEKLEETAKVDRSSYDDNPEGLELYEQALVDKQVLVFSIYPINDQADEE